MGALSSDELPAHFAKMLAKLDADKDGKLTRAELSVLRERHGKRAEHFGADKVQTRAELVAHVNERFTKMDTNQDGKLSADELQKGHHGHHGAGHEGRRPDRQG